MACLGHIEDPRVIFFIIITLMKRFIALLLLLAVQALVVKQANEAENPVFNLNDTMLSTMGMFRLTLQSHNCTLKIEKFNSGLLKYEPYRNCYSNQYAGGNCSSLSVKNGTVKTDHGTIYAKLSSQDYSETALIIDDTGAIQL